MNSDYMKRHCLQCNAVIIRKKGEGDKMFNKRKYCDKKCRSDYNNYLAKLRS